MQTAGLSRSQDWSCGLELLKGDEGESHSLPHPGNPPGRAFGRYLMWLNLEELEPKLPTQSPVPSSRRAGSFSSQHWPERRNHDASINSRNHRHNLCHCGVPPYEVRVAPRVPLFPATCDLPTCHTQLKHSLIFDCQKKSCVDTTGTPRVQRKRMTDVRDVCNPIKLSRIPQYRKLL